MWLAFSAVQICLVEKSVLTVRAAPDELAAFGLSGLSGSRPHQRGWTQAAKLRGERSLCHLQGSV